VKEASAPSVAGRLSRRAVGERPLALDPTLLSMLVLGASRVAGFQALELELGLLLQRFQGPSPRRGIVVTAPESIVAVSPIQIAFVIASHEGATPLVPNDRAQLRSSSHPALARPGKPGGDVATTRPGKDARFVDDSTLNSSAPSFPCSPAARGAVPRYVLQVD